MKKKEIIIVALIIIAALGLFFFNRPKNEGHIVVYYHKKVLREIDPELNKRYTFKGDIGSFHLEVKNHRYRAYDVDCPNQICVHTGWVKVGEEKSIICAPNAISVVYETSKES